MEIKIKIKIKDVEIEVGKDDLKELYDFLDSIFGQKGWREYVPIPYRPWSPYTPWYETPYWTVCSDGVTTSGVWSTEDSSINVSYSAQGE